MTPGDPGDAVLVNYVIEHDYRWLMHLKPDLSLWSPPIFDPQQNTAGFTDLMLGYLVLYAPFRWLGFEPDSAFQAWTFSSCIINFIAFYLLARRVFNFDRLAANAGAFLFAFAGSRISSEIHPQLVPEFLPIAVLAGLYMFLQNPNNDARRAWQGLLLATGALVIQIYSAVYWAFFLVLAASIASAWAILRASYREPFLRTIRLHWPKVVVCAVVGIGLTLPFLWISRVAIRELGPRPWIAVSSLLPGIKSFLRRGPENLLYRNVEVGVFGASPWEGEPLGLGLATTGLVLWGFWAERRNPFMRLLGAVLLMLALLSLRWPNGFSFWHGIYAFFPGGTAIRAIARVGLFLLLPMAIAAAAAVQNLRRRWPAPVLMAICGIAAAEQGTDAGNYNKIEFRQKVDALAAKISPGCEAFLFSPPLAKWTPVLGQNVAAWASFKTGIPTVNGYSGGTPSLWMFNDTRVTWPSDRDRLSAAIGEWRKANQGSPGNLCWIAPPVADYQVTMKLQPLSGQMQTQTFEAKYVSSVGIEKFARTSLLINEVVDGRFACYATYVPQTNQIGLLNDHSTAWMVHSLQQGGWIENSQCGMDVARATVQRTGNELLVRFPLRFKSVFHGQKVMLLHSQLIDGLETDLEEKGYWIVPGR